jgi:hypothetical protein
MIRIYAFNTNVALILGVITITTWSILIWDHLHGGVPAHHLLANKDLPKISNWWGAVSIPLISLVLLNRIKKIVTPINDQVNTKLLQKEIYSFVAAILFAIVISISFTTGNTQISDFLFLSLPVTALFFPIYRPAYLLGFIMGMMYTFGGVLPVFIGGIMAGICFILFVLIHPILIKIGRWTGMIKTKDSH